MTWFIHFLAFLVGILAAALVIRNNPERSISWLNKVTAKAKAKAEAKWDELTHGK